MRHWPTTLLATALVACGAPAAGPGPDSGSFTEADRAAILGTLRLTAGSDGRVTNECGEPVAPQFLPAKLGGRVGTALLFAIGGGPQMATCYGDGPDLHLFMRDGAAWREIYSARGRMLVILPTSTGEVRDLADGGPGFTFPVWYWNGTVYAPANREISDAELANIHPTYLP